MCEQLNKVAYDFKHTVGVASRAVAAKCDRAAMSVLMLFSHRILAEHELARRKALAELAPEGASVEPDAAHTPAAPAAAASPTPRSANTDALLPPAAPLPVPAPA
jgi:hypothetical protein